MPLDSADVEILWAPQPGPQEALVSCPYTEILFGGARGGGKTDGILGKYAIKSWRYGEAFNAVFFRKEMPQADDLIERAKELYLPQGAEWREQPRAFRMPGGGRIRFRPLENVADAQKYQGQNLSDAAVEEAGNYDDPAPIDMMFGALRSKGRVPIQLILTANPGGPGQSWIRHRYIDPAPMGRVPLIRKLPNGSEHHYIYIPSRVQDNRILLENDPAYLDRLYLVGSNALVKAWLEGDWSVVMGAFFDCWSFTRHVVPPFAIPTHWVKFASFDWGSAKPFSVGWWAISDGSNIDGRWYPPGAMIRYREWYGAQGPNKGLGLPVAQIAEGIKKRENGERIDYRVADPACWKVDGGPSHAETMLTHGVIFKRADNSRVTGWTQMRDRMIGQEGAPMLFTFSTCTDFIRTVPALQHDDTHAEDVDCWVAGTLVATPGGDRRIEDIRPGELVDTPVGERPVLRSYLSGASEAVRVTLSDGRVLEGTPHHKIMIEGRGLVALSDLVCYETPTGRIMWPRLLNTVVSSIAVMKGAYTTIQAAVASVCIGKCGWTRAGKFQMAGTSIIETMTTTTMRSAISSAFLRPNTDVTTCGSGWRVNLDNGSRSGVAQRWENPSYERTHERWSSARLNGNARALIVALLLLRTILLNIIVPRRARIVLRTLFARCAPRRSAVSHMGQSECEPVHIVAVGRSGVPVNVYNLTVADAHLFYANGVLSSNTDGEDHAGDDARYACMSRPWTRQPDVVTPIRGANEMTIAEAFKLANPRAASRNGGRI